MRRKSHFFAALALHALVITLSIAGLPSLTKEAASSVTLVAVELVAEAQAAEPHAPAPVQMQETVVAKSTPKAIAPRKAIASTPVETASQSTPAPAAIAQVAASGAGEEHPDYASILSAWLEKYKTYPASAREQGIEGAGVLSLTIDKDGEVLARGIKQSTGSRELDVAIITMATASSPVPKPDAYASLSYEIPVAFRLR